MKRICTFLLVVALLLSLAMPAFAAVERITHGTAKEWIHEDQLVKNPPVGYTINSATQADAKEGKYNAFFPKDQLQTVYIDIDEYNLNYLLQNAIDEPYVMTTSVTIGGTTVGYCGLRTKGNYTLHHSYTDNPGSDRFSFTVNFGKYVTKEKYGEKQSFYGCKKISFNNFFFDKSMMKEYFAFMLMEEMGLPTPQFALAKLYINDQYYGVYFMVEAMDETVLEQYWNVDGKDLSSYLCKPTGTRLNYGALAKDPAPLYENDDDKRSDVEDMLPTALEWTKKLNCLSSGTDFNGNKIDVNSQEYLDLLGQILELEEVVKYFAVASWLCQMDNMFTNQQNYGLYISQEGRATLLPWDYDLAFGCYYPSTAETAANYPLDVMYQLDRSQYEKEAEISARTYDLFPLFKVIYQNEELMEQYHSYMAECSQIAALGGTVNSTGKSYAPAYFNSFIEALEEELVAAATEELASNVYYMNHIRQPQDVKKALPNLAAIIALRSVGVWTQVKGIDTLVCGSGCDLETLGNALTGEFSNSGALTTIDADTCIFATAQYEGGRRAFSPSLKAEAIAQDTDTWQQVAAQLEMGRKDTLLIYDISSTVKARSAYTLTLPLAAQYISEENEYQFFTWQNGALTPLEMTQEGNLFTVTVKNLGTVVVLVQPPQDYTTLILSCVGVAAIIAVSATILILQRRKKAV